MNFLDGDVSDLLVELLEVFSHLDVRDPDGFDWDQTLVRGVPLGPVGHKNVVKGLIVLLRKHQNAHLLNPRLEKGKCIGALWEFIDIHFQ